jgi:hypothetical protein
VVLQPFKSDALQRLLICDLVGERVTRESIGTLRVDIAELESLLDEAQRSAEELPHRRKYLLLVNQFLRRLLELHLELVEQVEQELDGDAGADPADPTSGPT